MRRLETLAVIGYVAFAGPYGYCIQIDEIDKVMQRATVLSKNPAAFRQRAQIALNTLAGLSQVDPNRLAAIGWAVSLSWNSPATGHG